MPKLSWLPSDSTATVLIIGMVGLGVVTMVVFVFVWKRSKLNWYEKNLLEIARSDAEIIRYKNYVDDDDTTSMDTCDLEAGTVSTARHSSPGSRPRNEIFTSYKRHGSLPSLDSLSKSMEVKPTKIQPDLSDKFYVPLKKLEYRGSCSMFRGVDMTKIDKDLYDSNRHSCYPSEIPVLGPCGSLQLSLFHDLQLNVLRVTLLQVKDLTARKTSSNPNPYFKVSLMPVDGPKLKQTYQSNIYKNQRSLTLEEQFFFDVAKHPIDDYNLQIIVFDRDESTVDESIGCCWLGLSRINFSAKVNKTKAIFWLEIMPVENENENARGEIMFSVSYLSKAQRLILNVIKARNLVAPEDLNEPPDPCIRVTAICNNKKLKTKKTAVRKATYDPVYNESLTFNIPKNSLCDTILLINVLHEPHAFKTGRLIGHLELPLHKSKDLWRSLIKGGDSQFSWYTLELNKRSQ
uniref:C2 domain-containing protein n=1 Tax=Romanomermis culicivorax TaxID=13658 RepID=A0A915JMU1_ROMCU